MYVVAEYWTKYIAREPTVAIRNMNDRDWPYCKFHYRVLVSSRSAAPIGRVIYLATQIWGAMCVKDAQLRRPATSVEVGRETRVLLTLALSVRAQGRPTRRYANLNCTCEFAQMLRATCERVPAASTCDVCPSVPLSFSVSLLYCWWWWVYQDMQNDERWSKCRVAASNDVIAPILKASASARTELKCRPSNLRVNFCLLYLWACENSRKMTLVYRPVFTIGCQHFFLLSIG